MSSTTSARPILFAGLLVCAAALAACGGSGASPAASVAASAAAPSNAALSEAPAAGGDAVAIQNFAFGPASLSVAAGTTVTWTNNDTAPHTATADDESFDSSSIAPGATFSQAFETAGTFAYHCSLHPNMTGTIEVN